MGVFKWLRRERLTVTTHHAPSDPHIDVPLHHAESTGEVGTIRTEEYKRDLAEFQARRSAEARDFQDTPLKKRCGRHSLPVSCTNCTTDLDTSFNYEKKSALKYKKNTRARSATRETTDCDQVPNIQFLFQNQVFMPGNMFPASYSEPPKSHRHARCKSRRVQRSPDSDFISQKHIDFKDDEEHSRSPPMFYKNNSLPFDIKQFLNGSGRDTEEVDGFKATGDNFLSNHSSSESPSKDECREKLLEVMTELKDFDQWADEQLLEQSDISSKLDVNKSCASTFGLPVASASNLDVSLDRNKEWSMGRWGVVPVQIKKIPGVTVDHVRKKGNTEVNLLRKYRHPNIILLMGLYPDIHNSVHIICERCSDSLYGVLHIQGKILSAQTSIQYAVDIANALVFLRMQGYLHSKLNSNSIMITTHGAAKLADLGPCAKVANLKTKRQKQYEVYSPEPQYVNIDDINETKGQDCEPLIPKRPSETYIDSNAVVKLYTEYENSEHYRWQAPELFQPNEEGLVHPCSKSDVYSLSLILWECCNASVPWKSLSYDKLRELYTLWKTGIRLPSDGTYPGSLLSLLQSGLTLSRNDRIDLTALQASLQNVKENIDELEDIVIPARLSTKKSNFSSVSWESNSPTESECQSPQGNNIKHKAFVHARDSSTESDKECSQSDASPYYETIMKNQTTYHVQNSRHASEDENDEGKPILKYHHLAEKDYSSACSTPIAKIRARVKDMGTPGALHRSDSTEYCSIMSPDRRFINFDANETALKNQSNERSTSKLSRSFTPKSYKPLHIKVPEFNLECVKSLPKNNNSYSEKSSYKFDIKNYTLPSTPIARSNKLRKNAWLSGDLSAIRRSSDNLKSMSESSKVNEPIITRSAPETPIISTHSSQENKDISLDKKSQGFYLEDSPEILDIARDSFTGLRRTSAPQDFYTPEKEVAHVKSSWSSRLSTNEKKPTETEDVLANVNVKPLVEIHERWIYEANRKTGRSMSLPEEKKFSIPAVKPASHCVVDTLQKSLPQLNVKRLNIPKAFRGFTPSPSGKNAQPWDFYQTRETIARNLNLSRDADRFNTWKKATADKSLSTDTTTTSTNEKVDRATDTNSIEDFIRDLIRKEFQSMLQEISDNASTSTSCKNEEIVNKGVANIIENLRHSDEIDPSPKKESPKTSFSRVKINGNNKPLLQITFSRSGENSLQVLDNCVNVTICDSGVCSKEKLNLSVEDTLVADDFQSTGLKRCQAFNAIQEARSTEDLYIDDDLSTQMQENFGGKVKLLPLHGSLHEIMCERQDECCLIKLKQENGCDSIYFRCDNSDTESRDAIDGRPDQDTVVFKRSISLVEERIQRIFPKEKRGTTPQRNVFRSNEIKTRPKSEVYIKNITRESRVLSNSSPSLMMGNDEEMEVNIENVMSYEDSSSDECQVDNDDFELLERKIEEDVADGNLSSMTCGYLEKISEENLSILTEDLTDKDRRSSPETD